VVPLDEARVVHAELEAYAQVVLHAADLSAEAHPIFAKCIGRCLELVAVHLQLVAQAGAQGVPLFTDEVGALQDVDSFLRMG